jgi:hypothetical protein
MNKYITAELLPSEDGGNPRRASSRKKSEDVEEHLKIDLVVRYPIR